jgi:hypothetical protein
MGGSVVTRGRQECVESLWKSNSKEFTWNTWTLIVKVNLSLCRPREAPSAPGTRGFQNFQAVGI